jgi:hypothetical protein
METLTQLKDNSSKIKVDICSMSIKRNNSTGITLKIKSQKFENFFKNNESRVTGESVFINDVQVEERLKRTNIFGRENQFYYNFSQHTNTLKNNDGQVNLSFLLEERIGQGVEFHINGRFSVEAMNSFKTEFKKVVTEFYVENLQDVKIDLQITAMETAD